VFGFVFCFLLLSHAYFYGYSIGYQDAWEAAYQAGYNNALVEAQLNLTRRAEAFLAVRPWQGETIIYLRLKDFVTTAWELHDVLWIFRIRFSWSDTYEEACLYHVHNQTLHVYYLP